jgi:hypothetical protein
MKLGIVLAIMAVLGLSACTPVELARINCRNGDQASCIDYAAYTQAAMPGTAGTYIQQQRAVAAQEQQAVQNVQRQPHSVATPKCDPFNLDPALTGEPNCNF